MIGPDDRMYMTVSDICVLSDAIWLAGASVMGAAHTVPLQGKTFDLESAQFPVVLKLPSIAPFFYAFHNAPGPISYQIGFVPFTPPDIHHKTGSLRSIHHAVFSAYLVIFYERHKDWIAVTYTSDPDKWPEPFRFLRAMRNAIAHDGKIGLRPKDRPVVWHHVKYDQASNGRSVLPDELSVGDILILLFEVSDELDRLGAPR
jgi:hypothetical protein